MAAGGASLKIKLETCQKVPMWEFSWDGGSQGFRLHPRLEMTLSPRRQVMLTMVSLSWDSSCKMLPPADVELVPTPSTSRRRVTAIFLMLN